MESPELEELAELEDAMKRNNLEFMYRDSDSGESVESTYSNVPESNKIPVLNKGDLERSIEMDFLELEDRILRGTVELEEALDIMESKKRKESEIVELKDRNSNSRHKEVKILNIQENENVPLISQDFRKTPELEETVELEEDMESKKKQESDVFKLKDRNLNSRHKEFKILNIPENEKVPLASQDVQLRKTLELEETSETRPESWTSQERDSSVFKRIEDEISYTPASEKFVLESQDKIVREALELEDASLKRKEALRKLEVRIPVARRNSTHEDRQVEVQVPLMKEESVSIDLGDESDSSKVHQVKANTKKKTDLKKIFRSLSLVERSGSQTSVFQQIRKAKESSKSEFDCCKKTFVIIGSLFLYVVYVAILSTVPIAMIVVGSIHLDHCPVQPHIPIYLVVGGVFGILSNFTRNSRKRFCSKSSSFTCFDGILNLFLLIWFILGCVWVYGVSHVEYYDTSDIAYCHKSVYLFAFWLLNLVFILLGASVGLLCCVAVCCAVDD